MPQIKNRDKTIEFNLMLFDLDGTLVDKDHRNKALAKTRYQAIEELVSEEAADRWAMLSGVEPDSFTVDDNGPLSKAPRKEDLTVATTAIWLEGMNWFTAKEYAEKAYMEADRIQAKSMIELIPGTAEVLKALKESGCMLGVATNGSGKTAQQLMKSAGVHELFDVYVGADEVAEGKPMPDMIFEACSRLSIKPKDTVYVGDELVDAIASTRAGCAGVIIVSGEPDVSGYDAIVLESVAEITIE